MRDYSFGNFISAQRERCGLSQYQLGALVGVSDKAVSKWENGAAKPRMDVARKLAEVLDVSIDELLTCEYAAFNHKRKDLFAMKNEMLQIAKKRLKELYGENPPFRIANRFAQEKLILEQRDMLLWIGFWGRLQERFQEKHAYFDIRGAQTGASFIAWLMKGSTVNPLPAHYYCPRCKKVEFIPGAKCGLDLADRKCSCGYEYMKDGFDIDAIHIYPLLNWNEIYVSRGATGIVRECLQEYFQDYGEVCEIRIRFEADAAVDHEIFATRFGIIPPGLSEKYKKEILTLQPEEYSRFIREVSGLTVAENPHENLYIGDLEDTKFSLQQIREYFQYAVKEGKFRSYNENVNVDKVLADLQYPQFSDLIAVSGFVHSTGAWEENGELLYDQGIPLAQLISNREDVYAYLYDKLRDNGCSDPSGQVYEIKEALRKGKYSDNRMPAEIENLLRECGVPEWYIASMKKIKYLFPKAHLVAGLKRDICRYVHHK